MFRNKDQKADIFFLVYHKHVWKKKSDYSAVFPLLLRWSTTITIANIASCNLIISNLMFSTKQLCKQGGYLQKLLEKLLFEGGGKVLFSSFEKNQTEEVEF